MPGVSGMVRLIGDAIVFVCHSPSQMLSVWVAGANRHHRLTAASGQTYRNSGPTAPRVQDAQQPQDSKTSTSAYLLLRVEQVTMLLLLFLLLQGLPHLNPVLPAATADTPQVS